MLKEGLRLIGTLEAPGAADNPVILGWAQECGIREYRHDATAWCGLFCAVIAKRAGWEIPTAPLWALSWAKWGMPVNQSATALGDVLVFLRPGGGHVGLYVGEDRTAYHVMGGNQGDAVSIVRIAKSRWYATSRAPWRVAQPANVRKIRLSQMGELSVNEA